MICVTIRNQVAPENLEKFCDIVKHQRNQIAARQKGFKGTYFMVKDDGEFLMMTLWETREQVNAWYKNPDHLALAPIMSPMQKIPFKDELVDIWEVTDCVLP